MTTAAVERMEADAMASARPALSAVLTACVAAGASIGFLPPFTVEEADAWWRGVEEGVRAGERRLFAARLDGRVVGAVQLLLAGPANGAHRAEISKLIVHPDARRRGVARALIEAAEAEAARAARTLIVLDTRTGDDAERLYRRMGYAIAGVIPDYARSADGTLAPTTILYKRLPTP